MKPFCLLFVFATTLFSFSNAQDKNCKTLEEYVKSAPFKMPTITVPSFPSKTFSIKDYGANANGQTLNTEAFAKAIEACAKAGGGSVIVPSGTWLTGPIQMKSNINLHVERGGLILFTTDLTQYPIIKPSNTSTSFTPASPIYGYDLKNIALTGEGIIDGSGEVWRPVKKNKLTASNWKKLVSSSGVVSKDGEIWWPSKDAMDGEDYLKLLKTTKDKLTAEDMLPARTFLRPYMVMFVNCKNVLVEDITIRNSPKFVFYPNRCTNVVMRRATILNEWTAQNGDGIDISACKNVVIYQCTISVGDDGICMKSSRGKSDNENDYQLENIVIADNTVYHAHGGFVIGSNTDGNMRNIFVNNCTFIGSDIGIRVKSNAGRGGIVKDITISNISMSNIVNEAISFDTHYEDVPAGKTAAGVAITAIDKIPEFKNFNISNVVCNGAKTAIYMNGLAIIPIHDISFTNITIASDKGVEANYSRDIKFNNVNIIPTKGDVFTLSNSSNYIFNDVYPSKNGKAFIITKANTNNILIRGKNADEANKQVVAKEE